MGRIVSLIIISFFYIVADDAFSAVNSSKKSTNLLQLKKQLERQEKSITSINKQLSELENDLGKKNMKFIKLQKVKRKFEAQTFQVQKQLELNEDYLKNKLKETKQALYAAVLNNFDKEQGSSGLLGKKILVKNLNLKLVELKENMERNSALKSENEKLRSRLLEYIETEKGLTLLLQQLESEKRRVAEHYLNEVEKKRLIGQEYQALKLKESRKRKEIIASEPSIQYKFLSPLEKYSDIEYAQKGVTYKFNGTSDVRATRSGKIVYVGRLSTYGNVIMIDHGDSTRSILLGQMKPLTKKGQSVDKGETIASTLTKQLSANSAGKLYFEVRKADKVQNTYTLIDKESLLSKSVTRL